MPKKKPSFSEAPPPPQIPEWDPNAKESWFFEFEKEPVNDEKWTCLVTAAIPNETQDEDCIQTYIECVNTGLRKCLKIISMGDVIKLLKGSSTKKGEKNDKLARRNSQKSRCFSQIVDLAATYATFTTTECKLPPELMAALLKCIILNLKEDSCLRKRMDAVNERKIREQRLLEKFIRDLKPYEAGNEDTKSDSKVALNLMELEKPINDEPVAGPDLYILLTDFYNVMYFPELQAMNVPFVAILKISSQPGSFIPDLETGVRRRSAVASFWAKLNTELFVLATESKFKEIVVVEYQAPSEANDTKQYYRTIFDELTWTQYSVYCIHRQHQKYLQQLYVQKMIVSLEPLDLSRCEVYNKLCDALVIGEPLTPLLVLYAMVEQVVVGVPETDSIILNYQPNIPEYSDHSLSTFIRSSSENEKPVEALVTPCKECRGKKYESICDRLKQLPDIPVLLPVEEELSESSEDLAYIQPEQSSSKSSANPETTSSTSQALESLITKVLTERKTEKEIREDKTWKTPSLCFYGDTVYLQTYFCDPRLLDRASIVDRFLKNTSLPLIWENYRELSPEERAFCNFHLSTLRKISQQSEEDLKLQIYFTLSMDLIERTRYSGDSTTGKSASGSAKRESSVVKLEQNLLSLLKGEVNFRNYFLKNFIAESYFRKVGVRKEEVDLRSEVRTDSQFLNRESSLLGPDSSGDRLRRLENNNSTDDEIVLTNFYSVLNCCYFSNLEGWEVHDSVEFLNLVQDFKFYEEFEPNLMIQRLVEAQDNFNAMQVTYFVPTDTLIIVLQNDCDERGISCRSTIGVMPTPVGFRDFYLYLYPEISNWLIEEEQEHEKFKSELVEKLREKEEKKDAEFMSRLKRRYCQMSENERLEFLEMGADESQSREKELGELPVKPKPKKPTEGSFVVTNISDVRFKCEENVREFHSKDGTSVRVAVDSWQYEPVQLLRLRITRSNFSLYYSHWVGQPAATNFTFKTNSDIIFSFGKDDDLNNSVAISWPTGLMIRPVFLTSGVYIKQNYLKPYRRSWEIEEEKSRCFFRDGQVIIFKQNGDYDILFGSGTKFSFSDSNVPRYDIISTTGEVWQVRTKGPCKNKKTLMTNNKIFLGVDPKTNEIFYKREDGTSCMLWPSGRLVTNYPDGTKITTTPYFEEVEVTTDWTDEEKLYYEGLNSKHKLENEPRSKTILRNSSTPRTTEDRSFSNEGFISISCEYLMEHPKYSSVYFDPSKPYVRLKMPEELTVFLYPEGNYQIQQNGNFLTVDDSTVEFYTVCPNCKERSSSTVYLNSSEEVCKSIDFFEKEFVVYRNGETKYDKYNQEVEGMFEGDEESSSNLFPCGDTHAISVSSKQRCFAFERDLSGVEFLHVNSLSFHFYKLPEETYFELNTEDPSNICHTSNSPYYKIGYEKWVMDYEEKDSLPTNLKKKDLKEVGVKQVTRNPFKFPFPKHHNCANQQQNEKVKRNVSEPKMIVSRTVRCLSQDPSSMIQQLRKSVKEYHEKADRIFNEYRKHKVVDVRTCDSRYVEMRLRKIALTLTQSLHMYPHLCTNLPSTEKDIHYFGHFINSRQGLGNQIQDMPDILPQCREIPSRLPRYSDFSSIREENEST